MISHNIRLPLEEMLIVVREHLDDAARPWRQRGGELGAGFECTRVALADLPNTRPSDWQVKKNAEEARERTNRLRMSAIHLQTAASVAEMAVEEAERVTQELERFVAPRSDRQVITTPFPTMEQVARELGLSKAVLRKIDKLVKDTMKPATKRARRKP